MDPYKCSVENCPAKANIKCLCASIMFCETHIEVHLLNSTGRHNCDKLFHIPVQATKVASVSYLKNVITDLRSLRAKLTKKLALDMAVIQSSLGKYLSKIDFEILKHKKELIKIMSTDQISKTTEMQEMEFLLLSSEEAIDYLKSKNISSIKSMSHTEILENIYKVQKNFEWRETSEMRLLAEKNKKLKNDNEELIKKNQELIQQVRKIKQEYVTFQNESSLLFLSIENENENKECQYNTKIEELRERNAKLSIDYNQINASYKVLYDKFGKSMKSHSLAKPGELIQIYQCIVCNLTANDESDFKKNECGCLSCKNCILPEYESINGIFKRKKACRKCWKVKSGNNWAAA